MCICNPDSFKVYCGNCRPKLNTYTSPTRAELMGEATLFGEPKPKQCSGCQNIKAIQDNVDKITNILTKVDEVQGNILMLIKKLTERL